jgi:hypothetical protein
MHDNLRFQFTCLVSNSARDEQDVKSVLVRQEHKLNYEYLTKRAEKADVLAVLKTIQAECNSSSLH